MNHGKISIMNNTFTIISNSFKDGAWNEFYLYDQHGDCYEYCRLVVNGRGLFNLVGNTYYANSWLYYTLAV